MQSRLRTPASVETKALKEETELLELLHMIQHNFQQLPIDQGIKDLFGSSGACLLKPGNPVPFHVAVGTKWWAAVSGVSGSFPEYVFCFLWIVSVSFWLLNFVAEFSRRAPCRLVWRSFYTLSEKVLWFLISCLLWPSVSAPTISDG